MRLGHVIVLADLIGLEAGRNLIDRRVRVLLFIAVEDDVVLGQCFESQATLVIDLGSWKGMGISIRCRE